MASFFAEAIKGLQAEMDQYDDWRDRLSCLRKGLGILWAELLGTLSCIPYAITTMHLYKSLPTFSPGVAPSSQQQQHAALGVLVSRDVQYCTAAAGPRTVLDVYTPASTLQGKQHPVIVFLHGGVWASGEKWHYAPMATRLAQEGYVVVVPTYELYPNALLPQMVREVSDALTWSMDNVRTYGGDPQRIAFVGHSAGGHLAAMATLCRAAVAAAAAGADAAAGGQAAGSTSAGASDSSSLGGASPLGMTDPRQPALVMSMAGVYDIAKHFEFERARGVQALSMMERAMGGRQGFAAMSPTVIVKQTASKAPSPSTSTAASWGKDDPSLGQMSLRTGCSWVDEMEFAGEGIPKRVGLFRADAGLPGTVDAAPKGDVRGVALPEGTLELVPPLMVMSSCYDHMVPWHEGAEFVAALRQVGVPSKQLIYNHVQHSDYVLFWKPHTKGLAEERKGAKAAAALPDFASDFLAVLQQGLQAAAVPAKGGAEGDRAWQERECAQASTASGSTLTHRAVTAPGAAASLRQAGGVAIARCGQRLLRSSCPVPVRLAGGGVAVSRPRVAAGRMMR